MPVGLTRGEWHHFARLAEMRRISMSELVREALQLRPLEEMLREERASAIAPPMREGIHVRIP